MFNSLYPFKQQKRNFPEDSPHYPSLKRTRLWDENLENGVQQNPFNDSSHLIRNTSPNMRAVKPEYLPAVYIDVNDPFHNDMDLIKFKYMPDLNAAQNPHYYEYNRLLFELYLERIRRCKSHNPSSSLSPV